MMPEKKLGPLKFEKTSDIEWLPMSLAKKNP
jgi:hypothetical protein